MGVKRHAHRVDISRASILLPVCGATARGEASNQPNRLRLLGVVEGVLLLKAPALTFLFTDGILRCSRRGCANLRCYRGRARGKTIVRMLNSQLIPDRKLVQDLTYRAQCDLKSPSFSP